MQAINFSPNFHQSQKAIPFVLIKTLVTNDFSSLHQIYRKTPRKIESRASRINDWYICFLVKMNLSNAMVLLSHTNEPLMPN